MDPDIKHPRMQQAIFGVEHELRPGFSVGVTGIWRKNDHFIDDVLQFSANDFAVETVSDPGPDGEPGTGDETSNTVQVYEQANDPLDNQYLITNPPDAERVYRGVEFVATKRMSNRWQMQGSWVISKITGTYDNGGQGANAGNSTNYNDPNIDSRFQPFRDGRLTNDNTHIAKALVTYQAPWDVLASAAYFYTSGQTFTRTYRTSGLAQGNKDLFIEPRGSQRYDAQTRFDFKLEKQFRFGTARRLGVTLEGLNLFNSDAVFGRTTRSGDDYFIPRAVVFPRRFRLGAVYRF
jgi:hypothetical protein